MSDRGVETIFVIATDRGTYPVLDLFNSIRWSCQRSYYVVIVDRKGDVAFPEDLKEGYAVITSDQSSEIATGFMCGLGARWAIDKGMACKQFVFLSDACLVMQRGLDTWSLEHMQKTQIGLLGVLDRLSYDDAYRRCAPWLDMWNMPQAAFEPGPHSMHDAVLFLSAPMAAALYQRNLLVPDGCAQWPLPYGPFISWATQMLGHYMVGWGHVDKQMPPLFVSHTGRGRFLPAPHILSPQFLLYHSLRHVPGYSEEDLREAFKKVRGEDARAITQLKPAVFPQRQGPTVLG
jgi:hypothetical protein